MTRNATPWLLAATVLLAGLSLGGGIWLGQQQARGSGSDSRRSQLESELQTLQAHVLSGDADPAQQQRLLELLVASGRRAEATNLLEQLADREPQRWQLRLLLAELKRQQNDRSGAARELRQVLNARPDQIEALQLMSLLQLELGQGSQAVTQLQAVLKRQLEPRPKPEALATGLLLADVLQRQGTPGQAEAVLVRLATAFPADQRPLLARALLLQQRGDLKGAQNVLAAARALKPGEPNSRLDQVASAWGLAALREPSPSPKPRPLKPSAGAGTP
mgnify:FL=1